MKTTAHKQEIKFVYVDVDGETLREFDRRRGEGPVLETTHDRVLIESSEASEDSATQGVVRAYLGVDKHWHFDGYISREERWKLDLFKSRTEREEAKKAAP